MKPLVVGLGSMGKRRIRNLRALGIADILGVDARPDRREEAEEKYGVRAFDSFERALSQEPALVVISLPPDLHMPFALKSIEARLPFFVEVNVLTEGVTEVINGQKTKNVLGVPSSTMRYFKGPRRLKALLRSGRVGRPLAWIYHTGQYLPDWHPWESVQDFYVSKPSTAACREIFVFELSWLTDLLGPVAEIACMKAKLSTLPVQIEDIYQVQLRHPSGMLGNLMVDVLARAPVRHIRIVGSEGTLEWDATHAKVSIYEATEKRWTEEALDPGRAEKGYIHSEEPYVEEIAHFLRCVRGEEMPSYTFEEDLRILTLLEKAEESCATGRRIEV